MRKTLTKISRGLYPNKTACVVFIVMICCFHAGIGLSADGEGKHVFHVGISYKSMGNTNTNDATAAMKAWASIINSEQGNKIKLDVKLLNNSAEEMKKSYMNGEYDGLSVSLPELFEMNLAIPEYVYTGRRRNGISVNYIVIAHSHGRVTSIEDLSNCKLVSSDNNIMVMVRQWLDVLLSESDSRKRNDPIIVKNFSQAILQVFFMQADAAIVTREAFDLACELNPQLKKDIRVLYESPPLVSGVFIFKSSKGNDEDLASLQKLILNADKTPGGRQVLTVFQTSNLGKFPASMLNSTIEFLKKHKQINKESKAATGAP